MRRVEERKIIKKEKTRTKKEIEEFVTKYFDKHYPSGLYNFVGNERDHNTREIVNECLVDGIVKACKEIKENYYGDEKEKICYCSLKFAGMTEKDLKERQKELEKELECRGVKCKR